jgi:hypothetical protein
MLLETAELRVSENPDRIIMLVPGLTPNRARNIANTAVREARRKMPKMSGASSRRLQPLYGKGFFGIYFPDCVAVGTKVLRADWTWVPVETLAVGDALIGFDESVNKMARGRSRGRRYKTSHVTATTVESRDCVEVTFDDDTSIVCTKNHPWLAKRYAIGKPREWITADELRPGHSLGVYFDPWETDQTFNGGWLSGMFDGEGSLTYNAQGRYAADVLAGSLTLAQNDGPVLDRVIASLDERGFLVGIRNKRPACRSVQVLGGFAEQARLMGSLRPTRLLPKLRHEGRSMEALRERTVISVQDVGQRDVVVMSTSEETYIAEGMGSHNSYVFFQDHGIRPFTMNNLQGKTIPMWIDDPTGQERNKNPKAKVRTTASGKTQILIFRKVAMRGQRKTKITVDKRTGQKVETSVPMSYPGAPGRIANRETGSPFTTKGKVAGGVRPGNSGVRWRHPGLAPRLFLNNSLTLAAQWNGILPVRVYIADRNWKTETRAAA